MRIKWSNQPGWVRSLNFCGALLSSMLFYMFIIPGLQPFKPFSLTDSVSQLEGGALSLANDSDYITISTAFLVFVSIFVYYVWRQARYFVLSPSASPPRPPPLLPAF